MAIAVAGRCIAPQCLGVNVRLIEPRSRDFEEATFTSHERNLLDSIGNASRQEWLTRFWCAKEAVGKALGLGLLGGPQSVLVKEVDVAGGLVKVALGDKLASEFLRFAGVPMAIYTTRHREFVIASTLCERA
jgi:phosphopantetheine--protein transferase-like protein